MQTDIFAVAQSLSNAALLTRLEVLAEGERAATAELVAHLVELESRKIYLHQGYGSLFDFCTAALRLSEHVAYNCIQAARAARRFPLVIDRLAAGSVNLTTMRVLGPYLSADNHVEVLDEAAGRSKREAEAIVARVAPMPDVPSFLRKLPTASVPLTAAASAASAPGPADPGWPTPPFPSGGPVRPAARAIVFALAPERFRVQFTVGKDTHEKLRFAQDMLRREIPDGDPGTIFDRGLTLLLEEVARKKMAATAAPGPERITAPGSRHIPAAVKRAVWFRDRGQCAFVSPQGRRCRERSFLELHHIQPFALGGEATTGNIALRCRSHNAHEAEAVFGARHEASAG